MSWPDRPLRWLRESLGGLLLNIVRTGALLIDGDAHEAVVAAGRTDTEGYRADVYLSQLAAVRRRLYMHSLAAALPALGVGIPLARHITRPMGQLAALARGVVKGKLTAEERRTVEQHPAVGVDLLETVPLLTSALEVVGATTSDTTEAAIPIGSRAKRFRSWRGYSPWWTHWMP
jgi:hypothetical protein